MPLYEYKCHRCNKVFEVRQKFSDPPVTVHDECGGETERLISVPSFQFKGSGWYVTDYGKGGKAPATNGSNGKSESKSETKSEGSSSDSSKADSSKSDAGKSSTPKTDSSSSSSSKSESKQ